MPLGLSLFVNALAHLHKDRKFDAFYTVEGDYILS